MTENGNFAVSGGSNMTQGITEFATVPEEPEPIDEECEAHQQLVDGRCEPLEYCQALIPECYGPGRPMPPELRDIILGSKTPEPEPELSVVNCYEGWHADASGTCQPDDSENPTMPSCDQNPNQPDCETTSEPLELATLPEDEDIPEEEEQEFDDSEEELDEELEEEESEGDESGESEDEAEDEGSEQESEGESEEESEGGN
jgi:hypothetical protein